MKFPYQGVLIVSSSYSIYLVQPMNQQYTSFYMNNSCVYICIYVLQFIEFKTSNLAAFF